MHFQNKSLQNTFSKLLPQKIQFQNFFIKKYFFKSSFEIAPSKNRFSKLLFERRHFQENTFSKLPSLKTLTS